jgi:hypothetical protein
VCARALRRWRYQIHSLTWWRIVGLAYLAIATFMALVAIAWLVLDTCGRSTLRSLGLGTHLEPLCVRRRLVHTWRPDSSAADGGRSMGGSLLCRRLYAMALPCTDASFFYDDDGHAGATDML